MILVSRDRFDSIAKRGEQFFDRVCKFGNIALLDDSRTLRRVCDSQQTTNDILANAAFLKVDNALREPLKQLSCFNAEVFVRIFWH